MIAKNIALGFVLLAGLMATSVCAYDDAYPYLEVASVQEEIGDNGLVTLTGTVLNTHPQWATQFNPVITITFKRDGRVVGLIDAWCEDRIGPGETVRFSKKTPFAPEDYDTFSLRIQETRLNNSDPSMLTGELILIEESIYLTATSDGSTLLLGELFNGTNAVLGGIGVKFSLFDAEDRFLGTANQASVDLLLTDLRPGETISFSATTEDVPFAKVERWEAETYYRIERYELLAIPTSAAERTWGQIKQQRGGRE